MTDGNGFTVKEILINLDRKVDDGFRDLKLLFVAGHEDHETRLRALERFRYAIPSLGAILGAIAIGLTFYR